MTAPTQAPAGRLSAVLHNKPLMIGAVGAAGLGLYTAYRRKKGGSPSAGGGASSDGTVYATPANPANLNTIGTDVAGQLSQFGAQQQTDLNQWLNNLTTTLQSGNNIPNEGGSGGGALTSQPQYVYVPASQDLYSLGDLNKLRELNPALNQQYGILWNAPTSAHPDALTPHLGSGMTLRVS